MICRKHPAVLQNMPHVLGSVVSALDYGSIAGQNAERVVAATKSLLLMAGPQATQIFASLPVDKQISARKYFS